MQLVFQTDQPFDAPAQDKPPHADATALPSLQRAAELRRRGRDHAASVRFDATGSLTLCIADAIILAVGGVETTTNIAVDGPGAIYAPGGSQDVLVKFDAAGRLWAGVDDNDLLFVAARTEMQVYRFHS